jgi:hypothetical protein
MDLLGIERISRLGAIGEELAAESLVRYGFTDVENLNTSWTNYPFADLLASKDGFKYFIGVKTRNEERRGHVGLNESYNLVLINNSLNKKLKSEGLSTDQITSMLLMEVKNRAAHYESIPAWIAVSIRALTGRYSGYFGLVSDLGNRRSIPMTIRSRSQYTCIADDVCDDRITPDLLNR